MIEHSAADRIHNATIVALSAGLIKPGEWWAMNPRFPKYLVGSHGAILSLVKKPRLLKSGKRGCYPGFTLSDKDGRLASVYLHRLVAETFRGPCPAGMECAHRDGDKNNADAANLRWTTHLDNEADKLAAGTRPRGARSGHAKLSDDKVREMRRLRSESGMTFKALAAQFGVSTMTALRAVSGQSWEDVR